MSTIASITTKVKNKLGKNDLLTDTLAAAFSSSDVVATLTDGQRFKKGDIVEINSEAMEAIVAPNLSAYLSADLTSSATNFGIDSGHGIAVNDLIKIGDELLIATATAASNITATRGEQGTDAADHDDNDPVFIVNDIKFKRAIRGTTIADHSSADNVDVKNLFTTQEIEDEIKNALKDLYPDVAIDFKVDPKTDQMILLNVVDDASVWTESSDATAPTDDTSDKKSGTGSVNLGSTFSAGTAIYTLDAFSAIDASDMNYLNIFIKMPDRVDANDLPFLDNDAVLIDLGVDSSNFKQATIKRSELVENTWVLTVTALKDFATNTGTTDFTALTHLALTFNEKISITLGDLKIDKIWFSKFPYASQKLVYKLPTRVFDIDTVKFYKSEESESFQEVANWQVLGKAGDANLIFDEIPDEFKGWPMYISGKKAADIPSSNATTLDIDETQEELVELQAGINLLESQIQQIAQSDKLSTTIQDSTSSFIDNWRVLNQWKDRLKDLKSKLSTDGKAVNIDWSR
tara:strand:+ start:2729 stop:4282 length:1554 start_codon:yes stop_codon:yes gene_type:complete